MKCAKHPDREAAGVCTLSGKPYCAEELVELAGRLYAKDLLVAQAGANARQSLSDLVANPLILGVAWLVFGLCVYAFLLGNGVFQGEFKNEVLCWYILAKGVFCAFSLCLTQAILNALRRL